MSQNIFEKIKRVNQYGMEYWSARELMAAVGYGTWSKFTDAITRAEKSAKNVGVEPKEHFLPAPAKSTGGRPAEDVFLSRYACYLVAQNGDSRKSEIAAAQNYFVIQTRRQEVNDALIEDQKRVLLRDEIKKHNTSLAEAADHAGVKNYAIFQNYGYIGLYGGLGAKDIHRKKGLKKSQKILDHMGSEELAANLFRATQTDAKLRRDAISGEEKANYTHFEVGKKVRETIMELGGAMPESLPVADAVTRSRLRLKESSRDASRGAERDTSTKTSQSQQKQDNVGNATVRNEPILDYKLVSIVLPNDADTRLIEEVATVLRGIPLGECGVSILMHGVTIETSFSLLLTKDTFAQIGNIPGVERVDVR